MATVEAPVCEGQFLSRKEKPDQKKPTAGNNNILALEELRSVISGINKLHGGLSSATDAGSSHEESVHLEIEIGDLDAKVTLDRENRLKGVLLISVADTRPSVNNHTTASGTNDLHFNLLNRTYTIVCEKCICCL